MPGRRIRTIYSWLDGNDLLVVRDDRRESLLIVPLKVAAEIAAALAGDAA